MNGFIYVLLNYYMGKKIINIKESINSRMNKVEKNLIYRFGFYIVYRCCYDGFEY